MFKCLNLNFFFSFHLGRPSHHGGCSFPLELELDLSAVLQSVVLGSFSGWWSMGWGARPSHGGGCPFLLGAVSGPSFLWLGWAFPSPGKTWSFLLVVGGRHAFWGWEVGPSGGWGWHSFPSWACRGSYGGVGPSLSGWGLTFPSWGGDWPFLLPVWSLPVFLVVVVASSFWLWGFALPFCGEGV